MRVLELDEGAVEAGSMPAPQDRMEEAGSMSAPQDRMEEAGSMPAPQDQMEEAGSMPAPRGWTEAGRYAGRQAPPHSGHRSALGVLVMS